MVEVTSELLEVGLPMQTIYSEPWFIKMKENKRELPQRRIIGLELRMKTGFLTVRGFFFLSTLSKEQLNFTDVSIETKENSCLKK